LLSRLLAFGLVEKFGRHNLPSLLIVPLDLSCQETGNYLYKERFVREKRKHLNKAVQEWERVGLWKRILYAFKLVQGQVREVEDAEINALPTPLLVIAWLYNRVSSMFSLDH